MKTMIRFCLVVFLFMSVKLLAQDDMSNLRSTFQQLEDNWSKAYISGDAKTLASMYTDDAYSLPNNTPMWIGKDNIFEGNKKDMQSGTKYTDLTAKTLDVFGKGDIACEIGTFSLTYIPANLTKPITEIGKYIDVWQKQADGSWKIKADTWNTNIPAGTTQAGAKEKHTKTKKMNKVE